MTQPVHDDKLMDHEYDGIQELDNSLPRWWLYGFYFTIGLSVAYGVHFHLGGSGPTMEQELLHEMAEAGYHIPPVANMVTVWHELLLGLGTGLVALFVYLIHLAIKTDQESLQQAPAPEVPSS
jgi:hypothetical protein